jgi:PhzF family phenazine biosynthesis protein
MRRRFAQVDVFGAEPLLGNPVAVVLDGEGLQDEQMPRLARWTNLSETTVVLPPTQPGADYRVRIFTPATELPFAGHPTLGTCHAWLEAHGDATRDEVVQQCGAGLVRVRRDEGRLAFEAPPLVRSGALPPPLRARVLDALHLDPRDVLDMAWVDNGPGWLGVLLRDADAVLRLSPAPLDDLYVGVVGAYPPGAPEAIEVRAFFPVAGGTAEDPVTGSLNASLAPWLARGGVVQLPYVASQGRVLGRRGRVHLDVDTTGTVWVGGTTTTLVSGEIEV